MIDFDKTYDSHVHFFGVGIEAVEWLIKGDKLDLPRHLDQQDLIKGFGLSTSVSDEDLETFFNKHPDKNFCLSYSDGHSSLVSKKLIENLGYKSKEHKDHKYFISLFEKERDDFLKLLPKRSTDDLTKMAHHSFDYFKERGVKKVRHMTCTLEQWRVFESIYSSSTPPELEVECFFAEFMSQSLDEAHSAYKYALKNPVSNAKPKGLKLFVDGSIGQKTAYMSSFNDVKPRLSKSELSERMKLILVDQNTELALHTIGDLALELSIDIYNELTKKHGKLKPLHLEHAPVFTKKTLNLLEDTKLNCVFHFQPSHWIDDSKWYLKDKTLLTSHEIYPFKKLENLGYPFFIGSDAPIEESLVDLTLKGFSQIEKTANTSL